jgi:hypothetical protein
MKNFTMTDLRHLMAVEAEPCLSIYMPTDPAAATTDEQRIRFKNLLGKAAQAAEERAPRNQALAAAIAEGRRLLENDFFWRHQSDGLAVFMAPGVFMFYRLPIRFGESFSAGGRFAVKPLIPLFMADGRFNILALSQAEIRLFDCTRHGIMEIDLIEVPDGIAESLQYDDKHYQLQFHTGTADARGRRPAMFHGQGVGIDDSKDDIRRYMLDVNRGLQGILPDPAVPLVLAGVDYLLPIFREASSYGRVMPEAITGNPEALKPEELHRKALAIVRPELERGLREAVQRYRELAGRGYTAAGVRAVVPAAAYGRVDTLWVALDKRRMGAFERSTGTVTVMETPAPPAEDLLELAAVETIKNGGRVFALRKEQMPEDDTAAAILRY